MINILLKPDPGTFCVKFVRHSPGRRRGSEQTMYDVCMSSKVSADAIKSGFAQFRRKENPVVRPPEFADINVFPLVSILVEWLFSRFV